MELGLQFEELTCYEVMPEVTSAQEETLETAIPEYCPDIARIVDAAGQLVIREKRWSEERCTLSGSVKTTVLYTSEEAAGLRSLTISVPFAWTLDAAGLQGCEAVCAAGRVLLAEARVMTARKLYIKVLPEITLTGYRARRCRFFCETEEEPTLRKKRESLELNLLTAAAEKTFSFAQDVMLDGGHTPEDILLCRMCPAILSAQRLGSKLMVKGEMWLHVIFRDEAQSLCQHEEALPFSQILDVAEISENAEYRLCPRLGEWDVRVLRTDGGNGFGVTAHVDVCLLAYQCRTADYIEDIYSTRFDAEVERQEMVIPLAFPARQLRQEGQLRLEFEGSQPFISVTAVDCGVPEIVPGETGSTLRTTLHVRLLYLDASGAPVSTERTEEVSVVCGDGVSAAAACCCRAALLFSGGVCQVRLPVEFQARYTAEKTICGITAVTLTETERERGPSLILCRMRHGETLWDIARRYQTDEAAIRAANQLEDDADAEKYMMLIPRLR